MSENKPPMGDDPLAWLTEDYELDNTEPKPAAKTRSRAKRSSSRRKIASIEEVKTEMELVEESFVILAPQGEALAARFYQHLFEHYPVVIPLFSGSTMTEQQKKLAAGLVLLVQNLRKPEVLSEYLKGLGTRHVQYGAMAEHYPLVIDSLLVVMQEFAEEIWTPALRHAWENTLNSIAKIMLQAYGPLKEQKMSTHNKPLIVERKNTNELEGQLAAINNIMGVISFDMDGMITDINQNFLNIVGYSRDEVINKHHRMFVGTRFAASAEYNELWAKLNRGEEDAGEYKCIAKDGKEVWLKASYHPIVDENGQPFKVVKYAAEMMITAGQFTANVSEQAGKGDAVITNAISVMNEISEANNKVTDMITMMNDIAFQTNLLALNGSVEAAKAGAQGHGFSVIASEVRSLARRSASAAKEITALLNESRKKMKEASMLVNESGGTLE